MASARPDLMLDRPTFDDARELCSQAVRRFRAGPISRQSASCGGLELLSARMRLPDEPALALPAEEGLALAHSRPL